MYDPTKSREWKRQILFKVKDQADYPKEPLATAIRMKLLFYMPRPKSLKKSIRHHTKKPDVDNLVKAVKDALSGYCYVDDSQVIDLRAEKIYNPDEEGLPGVFIQIEEVI